MVAKNNIANKLKKAFTLLEMILVILILGIMSTAVIINFTKSKDSASKANIEVETKEIKTAFGSFVIKSGEEAPVGSLTDHVYLDDAKQYCSDHNCYIALNMEKLASDYTAGNGTLIAPGITGTPSTSKYKDIYAGTLNDKCIKKPGNYVIDKYGLVYFTCGNFILNGIYETTTDIIN